MILLREKLSVEFETKNLGPSIMFQRSLKTLLFFWTNLSNEDPVKLNMVIIYEGRTRETAKVKDIKH